VKGVVGPGKTVLQYEWLLVLGGEFSDHVSS